MNGMIATKMLDSETTKKAFGIRKAESYAKRKGNSESAG